MENENQKPKLSLKDIFRIQQEICNSKKDCFSQCPFMMNGGGCIISNVDNIGTHADEIETICTEWEMQKPTIADKINEILKPYGMKLMDGDYYKYIYIWFDDENENMECLTKDDLINRLYKTKWKREPSE